MAEHGRRGADERRDRFTAGLETALSDVFFGQLESLELAEGKRCPGEDDCRERFRDGKPNKDAGPLSHPANAGKSAEAICGDCPRKGTKPGAEPPELTQMLSLAIFLDDRREAGATFTYPDAFPSPYWWTALVGSKKGRNRHEEESRKRREAKTTADERRKQLEALLRK